LFGFGLPLEKDVFLKELQTDSEKDFAKSYRENRSGFSENFVWNEYENNICKITREVMNRVEKFGVQIISNFKLNDLKNIGGFDVVTIVGHWLDDKQKAEFSDGIYSATEITSVIPSDIECMFDSMICNSINVMNGYNQSSSVFTNIRTGNQKIDKKRKPKLFRCNSINEKRVYK
jgi:hypothetical protein